MQYKLGGIVPPIGINVKDPSCGILRAIQVVSFQYLEVSIKNARFNPKPSTPMQVFASIRSTPFMEIDDKGERLYKDMKALRLSLYKRDKIRYESFGRD